MPAQRLQELLDENGIKYVTIQHSPAYTAQEIAASAHVPGREMAKTVIARVEGRMVMAVVRAHEPVDLDLLRSAVQGREVRLAAEEEFAALFPGADPGAMPPFGNLYGMDVYVDEGLSRDERIAFNAGTHTELVRMSYADFERLVKPRVARLTD